MKKFEDISTGDQIQFTDGTFWTCALRGWGGDTDMVVFVPMSLKQLEEDGWCKDYFFPEDVNYPAHKGRGLLQAQPSAERAIGRLTAPLNRLYSYWH